MKKIKNTLCVIALCIGILVMSTYEYKTIKQEIETEDYIEMERSAHSALLNEEISFIQYQELCNSIDEYCNGNKREFKEYLNYLKEDYAKLNKAIDAQYVRDITNAWNNTIDRYESNK